MQFGLSTREISSHIRGAAKVAVLVYLAIYTAVYIWAPFSEDWNNIVTNLFLVVASSFAAMIATLVWDHFERGEVARGVWFYFAIGLWLWAVAEQIWGFLNIAQGEVPEGVSDIFWVAAYIFFAAALLRQYSILVQPNKQELWKRILLGILLLFVLYIPLFYVLSSTEADSQDWFGPIVNSFYPVADLLLGGIAIWLVRHFRGGAFSRPWLGLLAFCITDLLYAWIEISGNYAWSVNANDLLTALFDIAYLGAYLILGLGLLSQWVFLKYGMRSSSSEE
ncbi:MAG: hypothetical protein ACM33V_01540 [Chloroflexota bacterium]|nr:hypothetical protein [Anaerolineales bacterium]